MSTSPYTFGPVPSRRLGRSLGVDLIPFKTCTYDCIYCQLGRTTCKTLQRKEWVPLEPVLEGIAARLDTQPDYITLAGSGEPTLYSRLGELIARIKAITDIPVAVLTNGSLLWQEEVQRQLVDADLVVPSLDAGDATMFRLVNRPHEDLSFEQMLAGLISFRRLFRGQYWLEVFVVAAYTAIDAELSKIRRWIDQIQSDRVQLNTVTRPPAEGYANTVPLERLRTLAELFSPPAEVIADFEGHTFVESTAGREEVLALLRRRPCSVEDIAAGLGMRPAEVVKQMEALCAEGLTEGSWAAGKLYYRVVPPSSPIVRISTSLS